MEEIFISKLNPYSKVIFFCFDILCIFPFWIQIIMTLFLILSVVFLISSSNIYIYTYRHLNTFFLFSSDSANEVLGLGFSE